MSERTNIAWATSTWNPWIGCTRVGPGCDGCYAAVSRPARVFKVAWGPGQPRHRTAMSNWKEPLAWNRKAAKTGQPWRVFCSSLADVFDNEVPEEWREDLFDLWAATPHLTWLVLTKRIGNASTMLPWTPGPATPTGCEPLPNVWLGATVVNQDEADRDIPKLLAVPAAKRFLSLEPMLGPIDLTAINNAVTGEVWNVLDQEEAREAAAEGACGGVIDWVIVGGESTQHGHPARPLNLWEPRDIVQQCQAAAVPVFVKQMGSHVLWDGCSSPGQHWPAETEREDTGYGNWRVCLRDRAGADPAEWPEDLRVREFPPMSALPTIDAIEAAHRMREWDVAMGDWHP